ncbi:Syntaxin-61 [Glycine soja]
MKQDTMPSAQDPFYIVKQEIQESIDKLQSTFPQWEKTANAGEQSNLSKKVNGLDKAIFVASRDPSWYGIDGVEVENRRKWTSDVGTSLNGMHKELMRIPSSHQTTSNQYAAQDNYDFIESKSDR